jgi:23S rRNA pseudouridine1911/1915/1917 synthase
MIHEPARNRRIRETAAAPAISRPMTDLFPVIYEDAALLMINKPAGLVCHPTKQGPRSSLVGRLRLYLGKPKRAHLINRLDRETSGLVAVAKTDEASRALRQIWADRRAEKEYLAVVHDHVRGDRMVIDAPLGKDAHSEIAIRDWARDDGAPAQTEASVEKRFKKPQGNFTLLRVWPRTGRKHQIRIHLALSGHPIVGDKLYGPDQRLYLDFAKERLTPEQWRQLILPHQALHASSVGFPWQDRFLSFQAPPEPWFSEFAEFSLPTTC